MAKKNTKKSVASSKRVTKKTTKVNRKGAPQTEGGGSTGIMLISILGLVLLVYLGSTLDVDTKKVPIEKEEKGDIELIDTSITISGKTYSSREVAREKLKDIPQTQRSDEEISFIEGYKE